MDPSFPGRGEACCCSREHPPTLAFPNWSSAVLLLLLAAVPAGQTTTIVLSLATNIAGLTPARVSRISKVDHFLTFRVGSRSQASAEQYYQEVDPLNERTTLAAWKTVNGFDPGPDAKVFYFNASARRA